MYHRIKRIIDIIAGLFVLILTAPLWLIIGVAIRITMDRPILFRQLRPGLRERLFTLVKFRTMKEACDNEGTLLSDADRTPPLGRVLRRSSLDKLPQLWNVLRGDMSLVGPGPLFVRYLPDLTQEERRRHSVRPGLTGWAEVHGGKQLPFRRRLEMDTWYVDHLSLALDLHILLRSLLLIFTSKPPRCSSPTLDELACAETVQPDRKAEWLSPGLRTSSMRKSL